MTDTKREPNGEPCRECGGTGEIHIGQSFAPCPFCANRGTKPSEPVAWMVYTLDGKSVCVTDNPADFTDAHCALPLYVTPQSDELDRLKREVDEATRLHFAAHQRAEAAEAERDKLREDAADQGIELIKLAAENAKLRDEIHSLTGGASSMWQEENIRLLAALRRIVELGAGMPEDAEEVRIAKDALLPGGSHG